MKTLATLLLLSLSLTARARIGETPDECTRRYGTPSDFDEAGGFFTCRKGGLLIFLWFHEGKCAKLVFMKQKTSGTQIAPDSLSEVEIKTLLDANGTGWKKVPEISLNTYWSTADEACLAAYNNFDRALMITTKEQADRDTAKKADREKKKLEGF